MRARARRGGAAPSNGGSVSTLRTTTDDQARLGAEEALDLYRTMVRIRQFETTAGKLFAAGQLPGFIHLSIGQEAVAAGVCGALRRTDGRKKEVGRSGEADDTGNYIDGFHFFPFGPE